MSDAAKPASGADLPEHRLVIGVECHVQLDT